MSINIGENIKKLRNQKSVTQEKLAESLGVTPQAISRWESGAGYPAIEYLPDLAGFFGISVDELLGVKLSEREAKREEWYGLIDHIEECGYNPTAIDLLREAHAEFPGDRKLSLALAKALCSEWEEDNPDQAHLREAEKMLRDLFRQADDYDFRFACVRELAVLYKEAWKDEKGYEEVVKLLPSVSSCREVFIADFFNGATQKPEEISECVQALALRSVNLLRDYVAYSLPNGEETWDTKIRSLIRMIDFCELIAENVKEVRAYEANSCIAALHRYIATYYVAQGKKEETLTQLGQMLESVKKALAASKGVKALHNIAWYFLRYFDHERYDPVRDDVRFAAIEQEMKTLAEG